MSPDARRDSAGIFFVDGAVAAERNNVHDANAFNLPVHRLSSLCTFDGLGTEHEFLSRWEVEWDYTIHHPGPRKRTQEKRLIGDGAFRQ